MDAKSSKWLTRSEAADLLGVTAERVRQLQLDGDLAGTDNRKRRYLLVNVVALRERRDAEVAAALADQANESRDWSVVSRHRRAALISASRARARRAAMESR